MIRRLATALTYCGAIPFYLGFALWPAWPEAPRAVLAYGAVIAAFVSGLGWTQALIQPDRASSSLLVISNVTALAAWIALLVPMGKAGFVLQLSAFAVLLGVDLLLRRSGAWPEWFWAVRRNVSALVIAGLICWAVLA